MVPWTCAFIFECIQSKSFVLLFWIVHLNYTAVAIWKQPFTVVGEAWAISSDKWYFFLNNMERHSYLPIFTLISEPDYEKSCIKWMQLTHLKESGHILDIQIIAFEES